MKSLLDTWSEEEKRKHDQFDRTVAALMIQDEKGQIRPRDDLTDRQVELIDRWHVREADPAYQRMEWVRHRRQAGKRKKWSPETTVLVVLAAVALIIGFWVKLTLTDFFILWLIYMVAAAKLDLAKLLEQKEENQLLREWELHEKVNLTREDVFEIRKRQENSDRRHRTGECKCSGGSQGN
jgi:hypothetical protein